MGETNIRNKRGERERGEDVCGRGGKEWDGDNRDTGMMIDGVCRKTEIHLGAIFP